MNNQSKENKEECCKKCKGQRYNGAWYDCCTRDLDCSCHAPQTNKEECKHKCDPINFDTCNLKCPNCGALINKIDHLESQIAPQTPDSMDDAIIKKGDTIQIKIDEMMANKYTPEWIRELVTLAHSSGRREGIDLMSEAFLKTAENYLLDASNLNEGKLILNRNLFLQQIKNSLDKDLT